MYTYIYIYIPGWWFQIIFMFHNIWDVILPIDELIFFKMVNCTTKQIHMFLATAPIEGRDCCHFCAFFFVVGVWGGCNSVLWFAVVNNDFLLRCNIFCK